MSAPQGGAGRGGASGLWVWPKAGARPGRSSRGDAGAVRQGGQRLNQSKWNHCKPS